MDFFPAGDYSNRPTQVLQLTFILFVYFCKNSNKKEQEPLISGKVTGLPICRCHLQGLGIKSAKTSCRERLKPFPTAFYIALLPCL